MQYILLFVFFVLFPICGFQSLQKGDVWTTIFFFFPLFVLICGIIIDLCVVEPRKKRKEALCKMFNLPQYVCEKYGEVWDYEFQKIICKALDTTTDKTQRIDLQTCQRISKEMTKDRVAHRLDRPFYLINKAFLLTGCHFTITDSEGKIITRIV